MSWVGFGRVSLLFSFDLDYLLVIYVLLTVLSLELCIVIYFVEDALKNKMVYLKVHILSNFEIIQ